jgi:hypothetical protein
MHLDFMDTQVLPSYQRNVDLDSNIPLEDKLNAPIIKTENFMPDLMQE